MTTTCVACGTEVVRKFRIDTYEYCSCRGCGTLQLHPMPSSDQLRAVYQKELTWTSARAEWLHDPEAEERQARMRVDLLLKAGCRPGRVLEVGAGRGALARELRRRGARVSVTEASAASLAALEADGFEAFTDVTVGERSFDLVVLWGVIEHLDDPRATLRLALRHLKDDGRLAIYTEDSACLVAKLGGARWHWLLPPEHAVLYSSTGMQILLHCEGFEVVTVRTIGAQVRSLLITLLGRQVAHRARNRFRDARKESRARKRRRGGWARRWITRAGKRALDLRVGVTAEHRLYVCAPFGSKPAHLER